MRRKSTKIALAIAAAAAIAAGGAAFTDGNVMPLDSVAGYGSVDVSGATVSEVKYTLSDNGTKITAAHLIFAGEMGAHVIKAGFDSDASLVDCAVDGADPHKATCSGFDQNTA